MARWLSPRVAGWLLAAYSLVLLALVFEPYPRVPNRAIALGHRLMVAIGLGGVVGWGEVGFALNVALFVPLTFLGSVAVRRISWVQWAGIGLLLSVAIELAQLLAFPERHASIRDVTANTLGSLLGALLAAWLLRRRAARASARQDG